MGEEVEKQGLADTENTAGTTKKDEKVPSNKKEESKVEYPSAKLMLGIAQKEYEYEVDRKKTLETRSGIYVAFIGVMFTFVTKNVDITMFTTVPQNFFMVYALLFGLFYLIPLLLLTFAFYCFTHVIISKTYARLDMKNFNENRAQLSEDKAALKIMSYYKETVTVNTERNDKKSKYFNYGVKSTGIAAALILLLFIITVSL